MAKAFFSVFIKFIKTIADFVLAPINLLVVNLVPDFSNLINQFNSTITSYLTPNIAFFSHLLPPITRNIILIYLGYMVAYYTLSITAHVVLKIFTIIKQIKIW